MPEAPSSVRAGAKEALRTAGAALGKLVGRPSRIHSLLTGGWAWAQSNPRRAIVGGTGFLAAGFFLLQLIPSNRDGSFLIAAVQEGPFEVKIVESGTLQALRSVTYSSAIPGGQAKIIYLVPEGSSVEENDLLIQFDSTPFEDELRKTEAQATQAKAERIKAEQDLKLLRIRNQDELTEARDKQRLAELELSSIEEGKGKVAEAESAASLAQARRDLEKAVSNYEDLKPLLEEGFITKLELDRARQAVEKAEEDLELLEIKHQTYMEYTRPAEVEGGRAALYNAKEALRQLEQATTYRLSQAQAALELARSKVAELGGKMELQKQNISHCEIRATVSGMVIYKDVFFGSDKRKVQVGDQVWPNQPLIMLPDLSQMVVETQVRETDIYKVEKNQQVVIRVDAYPELELKGEVSFIGTLAQEERGVRAGKYFRVTILIREVDPRLRPGMTTRVELLVDRIEEARFIPLEAVFEKGGRRYCWVLRDGDPEVQEVLTGPSNDNHIVIEAGLEGGERVLLREPTEGERPLGSTSTPDFLDIVSPPSSPK
jgi:RND family efflux transporter MFP subunit